MCAVETAYANRKYVATMAHTHCKYNFPFFSFSKQLFSDFEEQTMQTGILNFKIRAYILIYLRLPERSTTSEYGF